MKKFKKFQGSKCKIERMLFVIGLIGAMTVEIQRLKNRMTQVTEETVSGMTFLQGKLEGVECAAAVCGVGKVNAAMCAQTMILRYRPSVVINTGVAGGIGKGIKIGDIVVADFVVQHDMDTSDLGDPKGLIPGADRIQIPCSQEWNEKIRQAGRSLKGISLYGGTVATGDQFIGSREKLNRLTEEFGAVACEMEGGSIGQVCYLNQVPCTVIRAISDNANDDAHMDYPQFLEMAAANSADLLCRVFQSLN